MRVMDGLEAFPSILLALVIMATLGPATENVIIALTVVAVVLVLVFLSPYSPASPNAPNGTTARSRVVTAATDAIVPIQFLTPADHSHPDRIRGPLLVGLWTGTATTYQANLTATLYEIPAGGEPIAAVDLADADVSCGHGMHSPIEPPRECGRTGASRCPAGRRQRSPRATRPRRRCPGPGWRRRRLGRRPVGHAGADRARPWSRSATSRARGWGPRAAGVPGRRSCGTCSGTPTGPPYWTA